MPLVRVTLDRQVLTELMEERGLTNAALASALRVSPSTITRIRTGFRQPGLDLARSLQTVFPDAPDLLIEHHEADVETEVSAGSDL